MAAGRRPIVLLVDDDADVRFLSRHTLVDDAEVLEADCTDAARPLVEEHHPDVIVLDHQMPGTTGVEYAEELVMTGYDGTIILFTAHLSPVLAEQIEALGLEGVAKTDLDRARALVAAGTADRA